MSITSKVTAVTAAALAIAGIGFGVASAAPTEEKTASDEKAASAATPVGPGTTIIAERTDGSRTRCTVAFVATTPSGQPVALTAAHCALPGWKIYVDGKLIGETDKSSRTEDSGSFAPDWATIALNEQAEPFAASDKVSPESVGKARVGDEVCLQGSTSGWQCGEVTGVSGYRIWYDLEDAPGDSGGPIIRTSDNAALGIHVAQVSVFNAAWGEAHSLPDALSEAGGYDLTTVNGPAPAPEASPLGSLGSS
ncbi:S1 family peptidase [Rhodococcus sp. NPDC049939]|uniref:S1 family peptidase n=1 Tax=Rhodococcus sp. NPDC049939 TaxID=3155511 RepID=UPI0033D3ED0C